MNPPKTCCHRQQPFNQGYPMARNMMGLVPSCWSGSKLLSQREGLIASHQDEAASLAIVELVEYVRQLQRNLRSAHHLVQAVIKSMAVNALLQCSTTLVLEAILSFAYSFVYGPLNCTLSFPPFLPLFFISCIRTFVSDFQSRSKIMFGMLTSPELPGCSDKLDHDSE